MIEIINLQKSFGAKKVLRGVNLNVKDGEVTTVIGGSGTGNGNPLDHLRTHAERETLLAYLQQSRYNISACARLMKVSRVTIYRLCRKHQLELETLR